MIVSHLRDQEAISSAAPLFIVVGILFLLCGGAIFVILRALRAHARELGAPEEKSENGESPDEAITVDATDIISSAFAADQATLEPEADTPDDRKKSKKGKKAKKTTAKPATVHTALETESESESESESEEGTPYFEEASEPTSRKKKRRSFGFRNFFSQYLFPRSFSPENSAETLAELAQLRLQVQVLSEENRSLRDQMSNAEAQNEQLSEEYRDFEQQMALAHQEIRSAHEQRQKAIGKVEELESQLQEVLSEVETMRQENTSVLEDAMNRQNEADAKADEVDRQLKEFLKGLEQAYRSGNLAQLPQLSGVVAETTPQTPYRSLYEEQSKELDKMRSVLKVAKEQILALSKRA